MADIINLRRVKKQQQRQAAAKTADQNRISFGRSKVEKQQAKAEQNLEQRKLDAHKRDV